ncbi:MAG: hypothetical protein QE279_10115 [Rhodoferax sp.]|nr:hypothetical protein [Rhodoferax sp.]
MLYTASQRKAEEAEWRAESDLRTMQEYQAICKDKKRLNAVKALAAKRLAENKGVIAEVAEHQAGGDKD